MKMSKMTDKEMLKVGFPTKVRGYVGMLEWKNLTAEEEKERVKKFILETIEENKEMNAGIKGQYNATSCSDWATKGNYGNAMGAVSRENQELFNCLKWIENN